MGIHGIVSGISGMKKMAICQGIGMVIYDEKWCETQE